MNANILHQDKFIPVLYDKIPDNIQEQARLELNETDENIQKGMTKLKDYLKKEKFPPLSDEYLLACLRVSKYETKKAEERLKRHYSMRCRLAEDFEKLDLEKVRNIIRTKMFGYLPFRDGDGHAVFYTRGAEWYPDIHDYEDCVLVAYLMVFHLISIPVTTISGIRYLCDVKARDYDQYYQYFKILKANIFLMKTFPVRLQFDGIHDSPINHWIYTLLRPFLPKKIAKRVRLHGYSYESLHTVIDCSIVPEEYGGTLGPLNNEFLMEKFEIFFHEFKAENTHYLKR